MFHDEVNIFSIKLLTLTKRGHALVFTIFIYLLFLFCFVLFLFCFCFLFFVFVFVFCFVLFFCFVFMIRNIFHNVGAIPIDLLILVTNKMFNLTICQVNDWIKVDKAWFPFHDGDNWIRRRRLTRQVLRGFVLVTTLVKFKINITSIKIDNGEI